MQKSERHTMRLPPKVEIFLILLTSLLFILPVLYLSRNMTFRLYSDFDSMLPMYESTIHLIKTGQLFPNWNPYIGHGIPILGDPLSGILNPFLTIPLYIWGTEVGTRFIFWELIFLSGLSMRWFVRSLGVGSWVRLWAACIYAISGGLIGKIGAGHLEQFFAYPMIPLILSVTLLRELKIINVIQAGFYISILFYTGATYHFFYMLILFTGVQIYYLMTNPRSIRSHIFAYIAVIFVILIICFPKLYDFLTNVQPILRRTIIDPTRGSLHLIYFLVPFVMPYHVPFYGRPRLQAFMGLYYNWYEYYSFISPLPFVLFLKIKTLWTDSRFKVLCITLILGALFIASRYVYSPFYLMYTYIPFISTFRVPQRMYVPMSTVVIALIAVSAQILLQKNNKFRKIIPIILAASFLWTFITTQHLFLIEAFERKFETPQKVALELRARDDGDYYVAQLYPRIQGYLIRAGIPIINYYYGWNNKYDPIYSTDDNPFIQDEFNRIRPKYVILNSSEKRLAQHGYSVFFTIDDATVWKTETMNVVPSQLH